MTVSRPFNASLLGCFLASQPFLLGEAEQAARNKEAGLPSGTSFGTLRAVAWF